MNTFAVYNEKVRVTNVTINSRETHMASTTMAPKELFLDQYGQLLSVDKLTDPDDDNYKAD